MADTALEIRSKATFLTRARQFYKSVRSVLPFSGVGGQSPSSLALTPDPYNTVGRYAGTQRDFAKEVGDLSRHSLVMSAVNWLGTQMTEAPLRVYKEDSQRQQQEQRTHPLTKLLKQPNPYYTGPMLYKSFALSWLIDGNVYWWKERNGIGAVKGLWYLPHYAVTPLFPEDGSVYISAYAYRVDGVDYIIRKEDIVHFRYNLDPSNIRKGLSPFASLLRELYCDNERANFSAALLSNFGIPGVIMSPSTEGNIINDTSRQELKESFRRQFTGDRRGEPMVASAPIKVERLGFQPKELDLSNQADLPEERVAAVTGIPAAVLSFGAGLNTTNYATMKELREQAYEGVVIPTQKFLAAEIDSQLLSEFDGEEHETYCQFDLSEVRVLQEDLTKKTERMIKLWNAGGITRAELRAPLGLPVDAERDAVFSASAGTALIPEEQADGRTLMPTVSIFDQQQAAAQGGAPGQTWPPKQGQSSPPVPEKPKIVKIAGE